MITWSGKSLKESNNKRKEIQKENVKKIKRETTLLSTKSY
jgi:hypothetical protein